ncbi:MAG: SPOR domain-containing protein, partial [Gemmatimonadota bacterium]|nr:SPOR domain-containing protein [Gemmatimonadota bacterium]
ESLEPEDFADDIDLGDIYDTEEEKPDELVKKAAAPKAETGKPLKIKPVLLVLALLIFSTGIFFIWSQGIVSSLMRGVFSKSQFSSGSLKEEVIKAGEQGPSAGTLHDGRQAAAEPDEPVYTRLGYSIQLGSFPFLAHAIKARDRLLQNGLASVYITPLQLDTLGLWNRLYIGFYHTAGEADSALTELSDKLNKLGGLFSRQGDAISRHTPLALKIGDFDAVDTLNKVMQLMEDNNIPTYTVPLISSSSHTARYRLYVGAFEKEQQAAFMRTKVLNIGIRAEIVEREGLEEQEGRRSRL